jgi:hypothetical protein
MRQGCQASSLASACRGLVHRKRRDGHGTAGQCMYVVQAECYYTVTMVCRVQYQDGPFSLNGRSRMKRWGFIVWSVSSIRRYAKFYVFVHRPYHVDKTGLSYWSQPPRIKPVDEGKLCSSVVTFYSWPWPFFVSWKHVPAAGKVSEVYTGNEYILVKPDEDGLSNNTSRCNCPAR